MKPTKVLIFKAKICVKLQNKSKKKRNQDTQKKSVFYLKRYLYFVNGGGGVADRFS